MQREISSGFWEARPAAPRPPRRFHLRTRQGRLELFPVHPLTVRWVCWENRAVVCLQDHLIVRVVADILKTALTLLWSGYRKLSVCCAS